MSFIKSLRRTVTAPAMTASLLASALFAIPAFAADGDGDGVDDVADAFPCDASATSVQFFPASGQSATLLVEDQWPSQGDYDFNDLVLDYHVEITKKGSQVRGLRYVFQPRAYGALFDNGLAVRLPIKRNTIPTATARVKLGNGSFADVPFIAGESDAVVTISRNLRNQLFGGASAQINTREAATDVAISSAELVIDFGTNVNLNTAGAPFDVFVFRSDDYSHQIHLPPFPGTDLMRQDFWGQFDDGSSETAVGVDLRDPAGSVGCTSLPNCVTEAGAEYRAFTDKRGVPFVLSVPTSASYPQENRRIDALFPRIVQFGTSGGTQNQDFFSVGVNTANRFSRAPASAVPAQGQTVGQNAIASNSTSCLVQLGGDAAHAALSCKAILDAGASTGSGQYFLDPDGVGTGAAAFPAFCDMTSAGGGWTLILMAGTSPIGTFGFNSSIWTDTSTVNATVTDVNNAGNVNMKNAGFNTMAFTSMRFCMEANNKCVTETITATSARALFGAAANTLIRNNATSFYTVWGYSGGLGCNRNGFNVADARATCRYGILLNNEAVCEGSVDGGLGFGCRGFFDTQISAGQGDGIVATVHRKGWIFIR